MSHKILIIGAGLAGLALAQGLTKAGFDVTVFERDKGPTSRSQGYRISIHPFGMAALTALLTSQQRACLSTARIANVGDGFTCANEKMEPFFTIEQGQQAVTQFLRFELRTLLSEGVNIQWGKRLVKFEELDNQVVAHFEEGSIVAGDLLVGCDGGASIVRELLPSVYKDNLGSIPKVIPSNRAILGGQIDRTPEWDKLLPLNKTGLVRFIGPNSHDIGICFSERADRSPTLFWAICEEIKDPKALRYNLDEELEYRQSLLDHCRHIMESEPWHENLKKVVFSTEAKDIMAPWLIRTTQFPEADQFPISPTGKVTLIGDSAHAMPTERGLGGNNALEDARLLTSLLSSSLKPIDWPKLIGAFEKEMFARAKIAVQESENAAKHFRTLYKQQK